MGHPHGNLAKFRSHSSLDSSERHDLLGCGSGNGGSGYGGSSTGGGGSPGRRIRFRCIQAISPNSSQQGGPSFTLSVVGSNFISGSSVQWNGSALPTTFGEQHLAHRRCSCECRRRARPGRRYGREPLPRAAARSAPLNFAVPCVIPSPAPAAAKPRLASAPIISTAGPAR